MDNFLSYNTTKTYGQIKSQGFLVGKQIVHYNARFLTEGELTLFLSFIQKEIKQNQNGTVLKSKPIALKYGKSLYRTFDSYNNAFSHYTYYKIAYDTLVNLSDYLHTSLKKDSEKSRASDKHFKRRRAQVNRFQRSLETYKKNMVFQKRSSLF